MFVDNVGTSAVLALPDDTIGLETPCFLLDLGCKCHPVTTRSQPSGKTTDLGVGVGRPGCKTPAVLF